MFILIVTMCIVSIFMSIGFLNFTWANFVTYMQQQLSTRDSYNIKTAYLFSIHISCFHMADTLRRVY